jgi:glutaredoxin-related protein
LELNHPDTDTGEDRELNREGLRLLTECYFSKKRSRAINSKPSRFQEDTVVDNLLNNRCEAEELREITDELPVIQIWFNDQLRGGFTTIQAEGFKGSADADDFRFGHSKVKSY